MKLDEITKVVQQTAKGFDFGDFDLLNAQQMGTAENIPIYHIVGGPKEPTLEMYALKKDERYVSVIIGTPRDFNGPAFFIQRTWTVPSERNKGYVTSLYDALYRRYHIRLISDIEQSPETISIWRKLARSLPVKVVDIKTTTILPLAQVSDEDLYNPANELRMILEMHNYEITERFSLPLRPAFGGILRDYIHYTAELTIGEYL